MPRTARKKSNEYMYHIMNRSISEIDLFQSDEDKDYYLSLLKRYLTMYHCSLYAYCLMDNHVHLYINPNGFDISRFMHCLNSAYVNYYNRRYKRHGHLFQGRFASTIVEDDSYSISLSAYIHNNAKDIPGYRGNECSYPYSSYGYYIGNRDDKYMIIDKSFVLYSFSNDSIRAAQLYYEFTSETVDANKVSEIEDDIIMAFTENEYRSEKTEIERDFSPDDIVKAFCEIECENILESIRLKYSRDKSQLRALIVYGIRLLCGYTFKEIGKYLGNMSLSGIKRLSYEGYLLFNKNSQYFKTLKLLL